MNLHISEKMGTFAFEAINSLCLRDALNYGENECDNGVLQN